MRIGTPATRGRWPPGTKNPGGLAGPTEVDKSEIGTRGQCYSIPTVLS